MQPTIEFAPGRLAEYFSRNAKETHSLGGLIGSRSRANAKVARPAHRLTSHLVVTAIIASALVAVFTIWPRWTG